MTTGQASTAMPPTIGEIAERAQDVERHCANIDRRLREVLDRMLSKECIKEASSKAPPSPDFSGGIGWILGRLKDADGLCATIKKALMELENIAGVGAVDGPAEQRYKTRSQGFDI